MRVIKIECPNCHGSLDTDINNIITLCPYCRQSLVFDTDNISEVFVEKEKTKRLSYDPDCKMPVIKASICNGEQVAGFKDIKTGAFEEIMLIQ